MVGFDTGSPVTADTLNPVGNAGIGGATYELAALDTDDGWVAAVLRSTGTGAVGPPTLTAVWPPGLMSRPRMPRSDI